MIDELDLVKRTRPVVERPPVEVTRTARSQLATAIAESHISSRRRWRLPIRPGRLAPAVALLVVLAVVAVFLGIRGHRVTTTTAQGKSELVFQAAPAGRSHGVSAGAVAAAAAILQQLVPTLPGATGQVHVTSSGQRIIVGLGQASRASRDALVALAGVTGRLDFYDWEANALTPTGRTVASQLPGRNPSALEISQGGGQAAPGFPGAGSMPLYTAVSLAARQRPQPGPDNGRRGPEYFLFGRPGSRACVRAGRPAAIGYCYLAGPAPSSRQATASRPSGIPKSQTSLLVVPAGLAVLEAVPSSGFAHPKNLVDPEARFYVLRDHVALFGSGVVDPQPGTDASGSPDVRFEFTPRASVAFTRATAQVAHRGALVSGLGETLDQHFAVALGDRLITVPSIDYRMYPEGIPGNNGADITGGITARSVGAAAEEIELGTLPIALQLVDQPTSTG